MTLVKELSARTSLIAGEPPKKIVLTGGAMYMALCEQLKRY
jgi:hypothetical protein